MPRWVMVSGIIALLLALLAVVVVLISGGEHGPRRHSGGPGDPTPPASASMFGHT
jgi:hypothetical protein